MEKHGTDGLGTSQGGKSQSGGGGIRVQHVVDKGRDAAVTAS